MLDPKLNDSVTNTMSTLAVAQLLADNLPHLIQINRTGNAEVLGISSSLGLTLNLLNVAGVSYDELVDKVMSIVGSDEGEDSITAIDSVIKKVVLLELDAMISCANSPILGDDLMDTGKLRGGTSDVTGTGFVINLDVLDLFNLFSKAYPTDLRGTYFYGDIPTGTKPKDVYKSGDLDSFLWYCMNMVQPTDNTVANNKVKWGNRNNTIKKDVKESSPETFQDDSFYINSSAGETKFFRVKFDDATNNFTLYLNPERYRGSTINKTIYSFNKDYMDSLRILYGKPLIASILDVLANGSISLDATVDGSISLPQSILNSQIEEIIENIIESDDTNIEDCYFTFSNDEYDKLIKEANLRRKGIRSTTGDTVTGSVADVDDILASLDTISSSSTFQEEKTIIKNAITQLTGGNIIDQYEDNPVFQLSADTNYNNWSADDFKNKAIELLKAVIRKIVESVLTPKVLLIYLLNYSFANGKIPKTPLDLVTFFIKMIRNIVIAVMDELIDRIFTWVLEKIKKLISVYVLQIVLESIGKYKDVLLSLVENCTLSINLPSSTALIGNIDNVKHADILETKSTPGDTNC